MYNEAQRRLDFAVFIGWKILVTGNVTICRTAAGVPRGILPLVQMLLNWKDKMARFKACPGWRGPDCILFHYGKMKGITIINAALQFRNIEGDHPLRDSQKAHLVSLNGLVFPKVVPSWHCHNLFISCLRLASYYWREGKHGTMNICSNVKFQKDWKPKYHRYAIRRYGYGYGDTAIRRFSKNKDTPIRQVYIFLKI